MSTAKKPSRLAMGHRHAYGPRLGAGLEKVRQAQTKSEAPIPKKVSSTRKRPSSK